MLPVNSLSVKTSLVQSNLPTRRGVKSAPRHSPSATPVGWPKSYPGRTCAWQHRLKEPACSLWLTLISCGWL